jgi:hypothetical protein
MKTKRTLSELLSEAQQRSALLIDSLPTIVDQAGISHTAKTPYNILVLRELLIWRTEEFARVACELYRADQLACALTLTRSCVETVAATWYANDLLQKTVANRDVTGLHEKIMRLMLGSKSGITDLQAINVLDFVNAIDKKIPKFRKAYDSLSEYAHPNWSGMMLLYSKHDEKKLLTEFGRYARDHKSVAESGLSSLIGALGAFELAYNEIGNAMPTIIELCEADIKGRGA